MVFKIFMARLGKARRGMARQGLARHGKSRQKLHKTRTNNVLTSENRPIILFHPAYEAYPFLDDGGG